MEGEKVVSRGKGRRELGSKGVGAEGKEKGGGELRTKKKG